MRRSLYEGLARDFERRAQAHADTVRGWNVRGGAPPPLVLELEAAGQVLERERLDLTATGSELDQAGRALQGDLDDLNRRLDARAGRVDALAGAVPPNRIESGLYRELVDRQGERVVALQRAIDVYRFETPADLWLVIAHELGHALGLGHATGAGAVMSEEHRRTEAAVADIHAEDLALLAARCPELAVSGSPRP